MQPSLYPLKLHHIPLMPTFMFKMREEAQNYLDVGRSLYDVQYVAQQLEAMYNAKCLTGVVLVDQSAEYFDTAYIGTLLVHVGPQWYDRRILASEMIFYIQPEFRRYDTARRMIDCAAFFAAKAGAFKMVAGSTLGYDDRRVKMLYKRSGFVEKFGRLEKLLV